MYTYQYKQFKIDKEQNDLMKNLNKDQGYYDSLSMKSDKIMPVKTKNLSYKSVSEVDEFGEYQNKNENDDDEEDNKKKDNNTYTSRKSVESGYYKEFLDEDNSTGINNINYNNINNNNQNINIQNNK